MVPSTFYKYTATCSEADVPTDTVRPYELDDDYFKQKRKEQFDRERASGSVKMEMFGLKEDELYALPEKDLEGTVMFGVYYSVGMSLVASGKLYDNLLLVLLRGEELGLIVYMRI